MAGVEVSAHDVGLALSAVEEPAVLGGEFGLVPGPVGVLPAQYVIAPARYAPLKHRKEGEWRDIPVPDFPSAHSDRFPVVNQQDGMTYPGLVRASWDRTVKRPGLRAYTPHDLRHKWATLTSMNGVALHEVSRWLGHRSLKVTVDRYGHLTQNGRERCRQVVTTTFQGHLPEEMPVHLTA
ncbi:tyrosine-type recombinase/integrase [Streptomyces celluloflavus]|uniref:tyrosine-type recombinase/integrase n=1 Tax=Streptomyces celluloflavus TaxID=58344 RepID=UPI0036DA8DAE